MDKILQALEAVRTAITEEREKYTTDTAPDILLANLDHRIAKTAERLPLVVNTANARPDLYLTGEARENALNERKEARANEIAARQALRDQRKAEAEAEMAAAKKGKK